MLSLIVMMVKIKSLSIQIDNNFILNHYSKDILPSLNLIYGGNGKGKTTFLNLLENHQVSYGKITLNEINDISFFHLQSNGLHDEMVCEDILRLFCIQKNKPLDKNDVYNSSIFQKCLPQKGMTLSNGMRQIFKYYLHTFWHPQLLLLDEPFSFLDSQNKDLIINDLMKRKDESIIFLTSQSKLDEISGIDYRLELS
ncbi:MAG: ATP-binding cassette domain-containing protein [Bacteriovoracaceae bacterium]|nr:ATP-binding cassette domain-containing protein [Bacteriovoracaceae bacterium]